MPLASQRSQTCLLSQAIEAEKARAQYSREFDLAGESEAGENEAAAKTPGRQRKRRRLMQDCDDATPRTKPKAARPRATPGTDAQPPPSTPAAATPPASAPASVTLPKRFGRRSRVLAEADAAVTAAAVQAPPEAAEAEAPGEAMETNETPCAEDAPVPKAEAAKQRQRKKAPKKAAATPEPASVARVEAVRCPPAPAPAPDVPCGSPLSASQKSAQESQAQWAAGAAMRLKILRSKSRRRIAARAPPPRPVVVAAAATAAAQTGVAAAAAAATAPVFPKARQSRTASFFGEDSPSLTLNTPDLPDAPLRARPAARLAAAVAAAATPPPSHVRGSPTLRLQLGLPPDAEAAKLAPRAPPSLSSQSSALRLSSAAETEPVRRSQTLRLQLDLPVATPGPPPPPSTTVPAKLAPRAPPPLSSQNSSLHFLSEAETEEEARSDARSPQQAGDAAQEPEDTVAAAAPAAVGAPGRRPRVSFGTAAAAQQQQQRCESETSLVAVSVAFRGREESRGRGGGDGGPREESQASSLMDVSVACGTDVGDGGCGTSDDGGGTEHGDDDDDDDEADDDLLALVQLFCEQRLPLPENAAAVRRAEMLAAQHPTLLAQVVRCLCEEHGVPEGLSAPMVLSHPDRLEAYALEKGLRLSDGRRRSLLEQHDGREEVLFLALQARHGRQRIPVSHFREGTGVGVWRELYRLLQTHDPASVGEIPRRLEQAGPCARQMLRAVRENVEPPEVTAAVEVDRRRRLRAIVEQHCPNMAEHADTLLERYRDGFEEWLFNTQLALYAKGITSFHSSFRETDMMAD